jgi:hypothetical protein
VRRARGGIGLRGRAVASLEFGNGEPGPTEMEMKLDFVCKNSIKF